MALRAGNDIVAWNPLIPQLRQKKKTQMDQPLARAALPWKAFKVKNFESVGMNKSFYVVWTQSLKSNLNFLSICIFWSNFLWGKYPMVKWKILCVAEKKTKRERECKSWCQTFKRKVYCVVTVKQMVGERIKEYSQQPFHSVLKSKNLAPEQNISERVITASFDIFLKFISSVFYGLGRIEFSAPLIYRSLSQMLK